MTPRQKLLAAIFDAPPISCSEFQNAALRADAVYWDGKEFRGGGSEGRPTGYKNRDLHLPFCRWRYICSAEEARQVYEDADLTALLAEKGVTL